MKKILLIILLVIVILSISLIAFIKSPAFIKTATSFINSHTSLRVEIGDLSFVEGHRMVINGLLIEEKKKEGFRLILPHSEISASLRGILRKNIDDIVLVKPRISVAYKKEGKGKVSLPFTFNRMSVSDADVMIQVEKDGAFHISAITISLNKTADEKISFLSGSAFVDELDSKISLTADIDTEKFSFNKARIEVSPIDLQSLSSKHPLPFFKDKELKGSGRITVDMERDNYDGGEKIKYKTSAFIENFLFHSKELNINLKDRPLEFVSLGAYSSEKDNIEISSMTASLSQLNLLSLQGTVKHISADNPDIDIIAGSKNISLNGIKSIISGPAVAKLFEIDTDGSVDAGVVISGNLKSPKVKGEISAHGEKLAWKNIRLQSFAMRCPFEYEKGSLAVKGASMSAAESAYRSRPDKKYIGRLQNIKFFIPSFTYMNSMLTAKNVQVRADRAIYYNGKEYEEKGISVDGSIEGDLANHQFKVKDLLIETGFFKRVTADLNFVKGKPDIVDAALNYDSIDIEQLSKKYFNDLLKKKGLRVKGSGSLQAAFKVTIPENAAPGISGTASLNLTHAGFSSSDETLVCEGLEMKISNAFEFTFPIKQANFRLDSEAGNFELLYGKFYGSFRDKALGLSASGKYTKADDSIHITESKMGLTGIGNILLSGMISNITKSPLFNTDVQIAGLSNKEVHNFFIRETFQDQLPLLSQLEVTGESSARLNIQGAPDHFTASGYIQVADMDIAVKSPDNAVKGINIFLPLNLSYPKPLHSLKEIRFGSIRINDFSWSMLKLKNIEAFPSVWDNNVVFKKDIVIPVMGGDIVLKDIIYGGIFAPEKQLRLSIDIKDIDLDKASAAFGLPEFSGRLSGAIPRVTLVQDNLRTEGGISLELFGGKMRIGNLSVDNVFGPAASIKSDIEFEDIDLGRLTNTFDFGHISGVVRGSVSDLVISNGQAEHFKAMVESYKKKGVDQRISVNALKKISILGSGSSTSILDKGIYQLFKEYRYEKLGFRAYLKNDNLLLTGIENEGDKSFLVKGGLLPPKVDVINYTQNISFQEMVSRLERLKQAGKE
ncbi:MAG: hypothetical protein HZB61_11660 [Nitrospirae bacterium]|nr:hypothetical protein [Nitrospirota bacterium]